MPLSEIAKEILKKSGRPVCRAISPQFARKPSFGSIVRKVLTEVEEKKADQELRAASNETVEWHNCKHLVKTGDNTACRRFFSACSMDKCLPKYFEKKGS